MWSYYDDYIYIPALDVHAAWYLHVIIAFLHTSTLQSILSTYIAFCFVLSDKIDRLLKACSCMPMTKEISRNFITSGANSPELCARSCKSNYKIGLLNVQGHECWKIYKKILVVTSARDEDFRSRIASSLLPDDQDCTTLPIFWRI